ncbi:hypothetical protein [Rhodohalobacter sp.]|uniref:hypothetical protein n=1 Tax=Rhodohalobacter sp. TaxID=1974210 RepID=UPI002ACED459|nr:hypothetical protein [Rhodohalobacter sp.]MDZ7757056.1 hypothetical protein [Rhodohalobacter sp.]
MRFVKLPSFVVLLIFLAWLSIPSNVSAQQSNGFATLMEWEQRTLNYMLDRSHNYGGTLYNRGLFRENINLMSPEHEIDLLTYRYTPGDNYNWYMADQAYRLSVGSLNATDFFIENKIKFNYEFNDKHKLLVDGAHEEKLRANRFLFRLGYEYKLKQDHTLGAEHTLSNSKSDLDLTLFYRYGNFENGMMQAGVTYLDWGANVVQSLAEGSANQWNDRYKTVYQYKQRPLLFNLKLISPTIKNFRAELLAGIQTYSEKEVSSTEVDNQNYWDEEWAHYVGAMVQYFHPIGVAGFTYQRRFSKLRRQPLPGSEFENDFYTRQFSDSGGFFITGNYQKFSVEQWMWLERIVDQLQGETVPDDISPNYLEDVRRPFDFEEYRLKMKSRLLYGSTERGVQLGLEFHADYRYLQGEEDPSTGIRDYNFRRAYPIVRERSDRITFTIGYRINPNVYFLAGVSYDVDGDRESGIGWPRQDTTRFDGGFGRLSVEW